MSTYLPTTVRTRFCEVCIDQYIQAYKHTTRIRGSSHSSQHLSYTITDMRNLIDISKDILGRHIIRIKNLFPEMIVSIGEETYVEYLLEIRNIVLNDSNMKDMEITKNFIAKTVFLEEFDGAEECNIEEDIKSAKELLAYLLDLRELSISLVEKNKELEELNGKLYGKMKADADEDASNQQLNPIRHTHAEVASDDDTVDGMSHTWEPPKHLQYFDALGFSSKDNATIIDVTLFFPIELTIKDHIRRIIDTIGLVLEKHITEIQLEHNITKRNTTHENADNKFDGGEILVFIIHVYYGEIYHKPSILYAAKQLRLLRNDITHSNRVISHQDALDAFDHAEAILFDFKDSGIVCRGREQIVRMRELFIDHQEFRKKRARDLGWTGTRVDGSSTPPVESHNANVPAGVFMKDFVNPPPGFSTKHMYAVTNSIDERSRMELEQSDLGTDYKDDTTRFDSSPTVSASESQTVYHDGRFKTKYFLEYVDRMKLKISPELPCNKCNRPGITVSISPEEQILDLYYKLDRRTCCRNCLSNKKTRKEKNTCKSVTCSECPNPFTIVAIESYRIGDDRKLCYNCLAKLLLARL